MEPAKQQWFSDVFEAGLTHQFYTPADVVAVAPPDVLAKHLPRDVLGKVLDTAMKGKLSPDKVVSTVSPRVMSENVPDVVLWKCVTGAAGKSGITNGGASKEKEPQARKFLQAALDSGLKNKVLTPDDVVRHIDARAMVDALPHELTAKLLSTSLASGSIDAGRVIEIIGVAALATHVPTPLLWQCVQEIQTGAGAAQPIPKRRRTNGAGGLPEPPEDDITSDFHEIETDVRAAAAVDEVADMSDLEIVEESVPPDAILAEEEDDKKGGKRGGLFGRRKR